jgi:hypothetical protein
MNNSNEKMTDNQQKMDLLNLKKLYNDAFYWHLIHKGYTPERAELEVIRMNSQNGILMKL